MPMQISHLQNSATIMAVKQKMTTSERKKYALFKENDIESTK